MAIERADSSPDSRLIEMYAVAALKAARKADTVPASAAQFSSTVQLRRCSARTRLCWSPSALRDKLHCRASRCSRRQLWRVPAAGVMLADKQAGKQQYALLCITVR